MGSENQYTLGELSDEESACKAFDIAIAGDPRFSEVIPECSGRPLVSSPFDIQQGLRIDRVLMPSPALRRAGWLHGAIGVEIKASGKKLGPIVAQCVDYIHAAFEIKPGFHVPLGFVFVFPARPPMGDIESVMAQNRIGTCLAAPLGPIVFHRGSTRIVSIEESERNFIPLRKVGSR